MTVARGSATELETQLMICEMLNYLDSNDVAPLLKMLDEIRRMLSALIKNGSLYKKYKALADKEEKVIFGGRLGEYKYYDMDAVIDSALRRADSELRG